MQTMLPYIYILYLPKIISSNTTFGCIKHNHIEVWNIFIIDQKMNVEYVKSNLFQNDGANLFLYNCCNHMYVFLIKNESTY